MTAMVGYSFSAGPAMLPDEVRRRIREDLADWRGTGSSVLELSQWDPRLLEMLEQVERDVRKLFDVADEHAVLFLHGGASNQFAMVPMNLLRGRDRADYLHTGLWSGKAMHEARRYATVNVASSSAELRFERVPTQDELRLDEAAAYVHYTPVETAQGVQFDYVPQTGDIPLVADASSALFATPLDIGRFAVVYASAQKNLGVVGMTLVIVRRDLIGAAAPCTPTTFDYAVHERTGSRFTTPPIFPWYATGLMLDWVRDQGGAAEVMKQCRRRAEVLYAAIDTSGLFIAPVEPASRAYTNVVFHLADPALTDVFLAEAEKVGLYALQGHSAVGGLRASMYLGMPEEGAYALADFLKEFEQRYG